MRQPLFCAKDRQKPMASKSNIPSKADCVERRTIA